MKSAPECPIIPRNDCPVSSFLFFLQLFSPDIPISPSLLGRLYCFFILPPSFPFSSFCSKCVRHQWLTHNLDDRFFPLRHHTCITSIFFCVLPHAEVFSSPSHSPLGCVLPFVSLLSPRPASATGERRAHSSRGHGNNLPRADNKPAH